MNDIESRLEALEIRAAHQDRTIEELNTVIAGQWSEIDRLRRQLKLLDDQMAEVELMARSGQKEPPPPHY